MMVILAQKTVVLEVFARGWQDKQGDDMAGVARPPITEAIGSGVAAGIQSRRQWKRRENRMRGEETAWELGELTGDFCEKDGVRPLPNSCLSLAVVRRQRTLIPDERDYGGGGNRLPTNE